MSIDAPQESIDLQKPEISLPTPRARWAKILYGLYVLVMPVLAFWATDLFKPEWQNGESGSYIILLLSPMASLIFFPLLFYSILCYLFLLSNFERYSMQFIVRFGVYVGMLLALHFSIVSGIFFFNGEPSFLLVILVWVFPMFAAKTYAWATSRWDVRNVNIFLLVVFFIAYLALALINLTITGLGPNLLSPFLVLLAGLTIAAPFWSFLLFLKVSIWLFRNVETKITLPNGLGMAAWLGVYIVAWRYAILKMYELYAALPPEPPPDCYVATAAAQGHAQFVGSKTVLRSDGTSLRVNQQLQILKCAELALLAIWPRTHKMLRKIYDVIGTFLARRIQNPFLADVAYVLLKPWEWLAEFGLRLVLPDVNRFSSKIYLK